MNLCYKKKKDGWKIAQKDIEHQPKQYQNQQKIWFDTNKRQHYQQNIVTNHYQENDNPQWRQKRVGDRKVYQEIIQDIKPRCCVT